jgi:ABC-type transporter Mla subunit MlaD
MTLTTAKEGTNMTTIIKQPRSEYAPKPAADPVQIGKITVEAVDQIGARAAHELAVAADQIRQGADDVASNIEKLAEAVREHSRIASEHTAKFVDSTVHVLETVRALSVKLEAGANGSEPPTSPRYDRAINYSGNNGLQPHAKEIPQ